MGLPVSRIGIVGSGPMAVYALKHLIEAGAPLEVTVFEATDTAGCGMPYREGTNGDFMLCNAFSREIPELTRSFYDWLQDRPARELDEWELSHHDISPRAFYPRVLLGEYLQSEFRALSARAPAVGQRVVVRTGCPVADIVPGRHATTVRAGGKDFEVDVVIIATGHDWPEDPRIGDARLVSPWPHDALAALPPGPIGVLGSSLSAVDVVLALGHAHGRFEENGSTVAWAANPGAEALRVTMLSHKGIMPEGDFHYPFPYQPLEHINAAAVRAEVDRGAEGLLARIFDLLIREIEASDPGYLESFGPDARTIAGFGAAYFAHRQEIGGLQAVRETFPEARESMRRKETVGYRYALLRGHENLDLALRHLDDKDWQAFLEHLMPVFGDCYAAMPHLSLARVLAMDEAGVLELLATGEDADFAATPDGGAEVSIGDRKLSFAALVDARGQSPAGPGDLPFPSVVASLADAEIPVTAPFRLAMTDPQRAPIYCLSMPQILEKHPFAQGLPECAALAEKVVRDLLSRREAEATQPG